MVKKHKRPKKHIARSAKVDHSHRFGSRSFGHLGLLIIVVGVSALAFLGYRYLVAPDRSEEDNQQEATTLRLDDIPFDGTRAHEYLEQICKIGPRPTGSKGMQEQQKLLLDHFRALGGKVQLQEFSYKHPQTGNPVPVGNLIVHWHPEQSTRILLCTHYDTLPLPLLDPVDPKGTFIGANDGGSGVALLMELAHDMLQLELNVGIDFVFFDAEEFIFQSTGGKYFVGSEHFATDYIQNPPSYRYREAVLLDMIADKDLQIYQERNSMQWQETQALVNSIWSTARRLGVEEFIPQQNHRVSDDHLALIEIAKIPACDVIDFDYPVWHTRDDTLQQCSALSLAKVGWVIRQWLESIE